MSINNFTTSKILYTEFSGEIPTAFMHVSLSRSLCPVAGRPTPVITGADPGFSLGGGGG